MRIPPTPVFLYDADCGVCERGAQRMRARFAPPVLMQPWQQADLAALGVSVDECLRSPVFVHDDGTHAIGIASMLAMMATTGERGRRRARMLGARALQPLLERAFACFYRNRHRLPGGGDACRLPAATGR